MRRAQKRDSQDSVTPHPCNECSFTGKSETALQQHATGVHLVKDKKPFKCDFDGCEYNASKYWNLYAHIRRAHAENSDQFKVYACDQCNYKTGDKYSFRQHAVIHSEERPYKCDFPSCSYRARRASDLELHKKCHDPDQEKLKIFACTFCSYRARTKVHVERHIRTHTGDKPYACKFPGCSYRAKQSGHVQAHLRKHYPDSMLKCKVRGCEYRTCVMDSLKIHQETHNPERKKHLQCTLCSRKFDLPSNLRQHIIARHTNERPISCNICGLTFIHMSRLQLHTTTAHSSEATAMKTAVARKYKCTACNFHSKSKSKVLEHQQNSHSNARDFACDKCEYRAKCKTYLRRHQLRCHGLRSVRSVECQVCKKKFSLRSNLMIHLKYVHRHEKPHKCRHCGFATAYARSLRSHLQKQHQREHAKSQDVVHDLSNGGLTQAATVADRDRRSHRRSNCPEMKNLQCPLCSRKFCARSDLNKHISCVHAKERPFSCDMCEYTAGAANDIRLHKQRKHGSKETARVKEIPPEKLLPAEQLGIDQIYACPFCNWNHNDFMAIVRHTVTHRFVTVSLGRQHFVFQ